MAENRSKYLAKFLIPSIIGVVLFMVPVKHGGEWTILVKILADFIGTALGGVLPILCVLIVTVSAVMSVIVLSSRTHFPLRRCGLLSECWAWRSSG